VTKPTEDVSPPGVPASRCKNYRRNGLDSLQIAAKLKIKLREVNKYEEEDKPDFSE
jgi:hypothetical protein